MAMIPQGAGGSTPVASKPQFSLGLPGPRPGGIATPAPNIRKAFAVSEGGSVNQSPEAINAQISPPGSPPPLTPEVGLPNSPVGITGGDISGVDQIGAILGSPGRGLAARFQSDTTAPSFLGESGAGLDEDPLKKLFGR